MNDKLFNLLKKGKYTKKELAKNIDCSMNLISKELTKLRKDGISVISTREGRTTNYFIKTIGYREVKRYKEKDLGLEGIFGVQSDLHYGSIAERPDAEEYFLEECKKRGVKIIYNCGDVTDGFNVYPGHINEVKVWGTDNQAAHLIRTRPSLEGIVTKFITGNHDLRAMGGGIDVGNLIVRGVYLEHEDEFVEGRKDMVYLGQYARDIELPQKVIVRLLHPAKAGSYARSYTPQKYVESIRGGNKPSVLLWGHHHDLLYFIVRNVHVIKAGCFQDQTEFTLRRGMENLIGGTIIEYKIRGKGFQSIKIEAIPIYE